MNREHPELISVRISTETAALRGSFCRWAVRNCPEDYEWMTSRGWVARDVPPQGFRINGSPELEVFNLDDIRAYRELLDGIEQVFLAEAEEPDGQEPDGEEKESEEGSE